MMKAFRKRRATVLPSPAFTLLKIERTLSNVFFCSGAVGEGLEDATAS